MLDIKRMSCSWESQSSGYWEEENAFLIKAIRKEWEGYDLAEALRQVKAVIL